MATTCTEDGHKQSNKSSTTIQKNCLQHVKWMDPNTLTKQALHLKQMQLQHFQKTVTNRLQKQAIQYKQFGYNMYRGWTETD